MKYFCYYRCSISLFYFYFHFYSITKGERNRNTDSAIYTIVWRRPISRGKGQLWNTARVLRVKRHKTCLCNPYRCTMIIVKETRVLVDVLFFICIYLWDRTEKGTCQVSGKDVHSDVIFFYYSTWMELFQGTPIKYTWYINGVWVCLD